MQCSVCQHDTFLVIGIVHGMSFVNQQLAESLGYGCVGVILRAAGGSHYITSQSGYNTKGPSGIVQNRSRLQRRLAYPMLH